jgi:hypothetical protein
MSKALAAQSADPGQARMTYGEKKTAFTNEKFYLAAYFFGSGLFWGQNFLASS